MLVVVRAAEARTVYTVFIVCNKVCMYVPPNRKLKCIKIAYSSRKVAALYFKRIHLLAMSLSLSS